MALRNLIVLPATRWSALRRSAGEWLSAQAAWAMFQAAMLAVIVSLIVGVLWRQECRGPEDQAVDTAVAHGRMVRGASFPEARLAVGALNDPQRVKRLLQPGNTYVVRTKGGFVGRVEHAEQLGGRRMQNYAYVFETVIHRMIVSNNGRRIVEVRQFQSARTVLLLSTEPLDLELGHPDAPLLDDDPGADQDPGLRWLPGAQIAQAILKGGAQSIEGDPTSTARLDRDPLMGKKVRLTYVDGVGVDSIRPLGCDLSAAELHYLLATPVLYDGYLVPHSTEHGLPGSQRVPGDQFAGLLGSPLRQGEVGDVWVQTAGDQPPRPDEPRELRVASEAWSNGPGGSPRGTLHASPLDGRILSARLEWMLGEHPAHLLGPLFANVAMDQPSPLTSLYSSTSGPTAKTDSDHMPLGDLAAGLGVLLSASVGLLWCGVKTAQFCSPRICHLLASSTVLAILIFGAWIHKAVWLAELIPISNVIILGNWLPWGAAYFSGILLAQRMIPLWRRTAMALLLTALAGYTAVCDLTLVTDPTCRSWFREGICLQTLPETCSPCSAVTLLNEHGIKANEAEMTRLCLTRRRGTPLLGLYRGLKLKTQGTPWDVEIVRCSVEELRENFKSPVLLRVQILPPHLIGFDAGWPSGDLSPDVEHSVVLLGFTPDGRAEIGDPANTLQPRSKWTLDDLQERWQGEGFRLVERASRRERG